MNPKVAKWTTKIGVSALAAMLMGIIYKTEKSTQEQIDAKYADTKDSEQSTNA